MLEVLRRSRGGQRPVHRDQHWRHLRTGVGGKDHTTHHLAFIGISERHVMLIFWGISLLASVIAIVCFWYIKKLHIGYSILVFLFCLSLFITMQIIYNRGKRIQDICNKYNVIKLRTIKIKQKKA